MSPKEQLSTVIVSVLCITLIILAVVSGERVRTPEDFPDVFHKAKVVEFVNAFIQKKDAEVEGMLREGEEMKAALVEAELAAVSSRLLGESTSDHPTIRELIALSRFRTAGEWEFYERFLKLKYPNWNRNGK